MRSPLCPWDLGLWKPWKWESDQYGKYLQKDPDGRCRLQDIKCSCQCCYSCDVYSGIRSFEKLWVVPRQHHSPFLEHHLQVLPSYPTGASNDRRPVLICHHGYSRSWNFAAMEICAHWAGHGDRLPEPNADRLHPAISSKQHWGQLHMLLGLKLWLLFIYLYIFQIYTSSTAQGGGGSFKIGNL